MKRKTASKRQDPLPALVVTGPATTLTGRGWRDRLWATSHARFRDGWMDRKGGAHDDGGGAGGVADGAGEGMTPTRAGHHRHAFCGRFCVPSWLHEQFVEQLGDKADAFDVCAWYVTRDRQRGDEQTVVAEPLGWWRNAFAAELRARGYLSPRPRRQTVPPASHRSPTGIVYPCPHGPSCASTWACGQRQLREQCEATP